MLHWQNIIQHIEYSTVNTIHNTYTVNIMQQIKNTIQHKTHAGLNAVAVLQTQSTTYTAQCAGSGTNKMRDLQHITHEDTMHYLHTAHTAQQNRWFIYSDDIVIEMLLHLEMSSNPKMTIFQHKDWLMSHWIK